MPEHSRLQTFASSTTAAGMRQGSCEPQAIPEDDAKPLLPALTPLTFAGVRVATWRMQVPRGSREERHSGSRKAAKGEIRRDRNGVAEWAHQYAQMCDGEARAPLVRRQCARPAPMEAKAHVAKASALPFPESVHSSSRRQ